MAGFIIGSLVKVWPWSNMEVIRISQSLNLPEGTLIPVDQVDMRYTGAIVFALVGFFLVSGIEFLGKTMSKNDQKVK